MPRNTSQNGALSEQADRRLKSFEEYLPFLKTADKRLQDLESPPAEPGKPPNRFFKQIVSGIGILTLILGGLAWVANHYVDDRIEAKLTDHKFNQLVTDTHEMKGRMDEISGFVKMVAENELRKQSALSLPDFRKQLPDVGTTLSVARLVNASVPQDVVDSIGSKLVASEIDAPSFWHVAGQLISYRSDIQHGLPEPTKPKTSLPECVDSKPTPAEIAHRVTSWNKPFEITPAIYENCHFTLDSGRDSAQLNDLMLHGNDPLIAFKNCLISYSGGEVNLTRAWDHTPMIVYLYNRETNQVTPVPTNMTMQAIQFVNCRFDFSIKQAPPPTGKKATQMLLAQAGRTLGLGGPS